MIESELRHCTVRVKKKEKKKRKKRKENNSIMVPLLGQSVNFCSFLRLVFSVAKYLRFTILQKCSGWDYNAYMISSIW